MLGFEFSIAWFQCPHFFYWKSFKGNKNICGEGWRSPKSATWVPTLVFQHLLLFWSFVVGPLKSGKDLFILEHMEFLYLPSDPPLNSPLDSIKPISFSPCKVMKTIDLLSHRVVSIHSHFVSTSLWSVILVPCDNYVFPLRFIALCCQKSLHSLKLDLIQV